MGTPIRPVIAVSIGDPAGIGPEVTLKALSDPALHNAAQFVIVGDRSVLQEAAAISDLALPPASEITTEGISAASSVTIADQRCLSAADYAPGDIRAEYGRAAVAYIRAATQMCLTGGADAMVTGPVSKEAVTRAGIAFTGHTEYIAALCGVEGPRMLLVNDQLRVVHVSTHCSLKEAVRLDPQRILHTIRLGHQALSAMGINAPRIGVCGLNPHAGENGLFGEEDRRCILPAVEQAQSEGILCSGPLPADTLFLQAVRGKFDLVVAMYHDQGHIPIKLLDFEHTVNVSLGLPIIRTSVDHGTAFDIAGQNRADASSMKSALRLAIRMAAHTRLQAE